MSTAKPNSRSLCPLQVCHKTFVSKKNMNILAWSSCVLACLSLITAYFLARYPRTTAWSWITVHLVCSKCFLARYPRTTAWSWITVRMVCSKCFLARYPRSTAWSCITVHIYGLLKVCSGKGFLYNCLELDHSTYGLLKVFSGQISSFNCLELYHSTYIWSAQSVFWQGILVQLPGVGSQYVWSAQSVFWPDILVQLPGVVSQYIYNYGLLKVCSGKGFLYNCMELDYIMLREFNSVVWYIPTESGQPKGVIEPTES